jgi:HAD superfamily hydrolase (TIGR01509 family)
MRFNLLIFDCDGTLVDSEYLNNLATIELLHAEGLSQYDMEYAFDNFIGMKFSNILKMIAAETGHIFPDYAALADRYVRRARELVPEYLKPIAGAKELVDAASKHMKICVGSNGQRDNVIYSLERSDLFDYFGDAHIFAGTDVENPKPAPDLFLLASRKMNADPAKCLVIEDSVAGVTAGVAAGMEVWGFTGVHENKERHKTKLEAAGARVVHDSLIHIRDILFN